MKAIGGTVGHLEEPTLGWDGLIVLCASCSFDAKFGPQKLDTLGSKVGCPFLVWKEPRRDFQILANHSRR